jgi:hypothetical protein
MRFVEQHRIAGNAAPMRQPGEGIIKAIKDQVHALIQSGATR